MNKKNRCSSLLILALHHDVVGILNGSNFEVPTREKWRIHDMAYFFGGAPSFDSSPQELLVVLTHTNVNFL